jgi:hypothetical protein
MLSGRGARRYAMAEEKKGGFHAFEQRVHQLEEEDARARKSAPGESDAAKRESKEEKKEPKGK